MISLSLAVAMAMTAAPVTAMADEPVKTDVIEAPALTPADQTEETTTEEGTAWAELSAQNNGAYVEHQVDEASAKENVFYVDETQGNGYATLSDALKNACTTESTIVLKNNVTGDFTIAEDQNITLDLNGYTITNTSNHTITNNGKLTIKDSSEEKTGKITNSTHGKGALVNNYGGTVDIESGTLTREEATDNSWYVISNDGTMNIKGGSIINKVVKLTSSLIRNEGEMDISGGYLKHDFIAVKNDDTGKGELSTLTVCGDVVIESPEQAIQNWTTAVISGGTMNGKVSTWGYNGQCGNTEITGGTINGNITIGIDNSNLLDSSKIPEVTISNGTINGNIEFLTGGTSTAAPENTKGSFVINNGVTINGDVKNPSAGTVEITDATVTGTVSNTGSGSMAVTESKVGSYDETNNIIFIDSSKIDGTPIPDSNIGDAVAMIGASPYSSLGEAIKAVQAGDIIHILKDVPDAAGITVSSDKQFTVDFGGHAYILKDPGAGSPGTESNGFQLLKTSDITFKNGTIRIAEGTTSIKRIIQNYANLTLEDMHFYAENQADGQDLPLSFNNGNITFKGDTDIITPDDNNIAFDVCKFQDYPSVTVTFDESYTGTINGRIVYDSPNASTHKLYIKGNGTFGSIECTSRSNSVAKDGIEVTSGNFAESVNEDYLADTVKAQLESHSNTEAPFSYYTSLEDALKAAKPGDKVTEVNPDHPGAQYTVTLKYNDGVTPDSVYTVSADIPITLPTPSRSHYSFEGWYDGNDLVESPYTVTENVELTAKWHRTSSGGGSSHRYDGYITVIDSKNGDVSVSDTWADEDDKITLTITPDKGYVVDKIEIVDAEGDKIDAKKVEDKDDKYTFRMANCDVTVTVTFKEEGKTTEDTDKEEDKDDETTETTKLNFTDVKETDWFFKGVEYVVDKDIMSGVSENEFAPSGKLTRAMLVQMLYNMESRPACNAENAFIDVPVGQWYTDAVIWANDAKIVSGMGEGLFAPNMEITREQMVAMLYNYAKYKGYDVTASADLSTFADNASVSAWAKPAMQWAVAEGYISGMGDNQLAPQGTATRAEIASVIMRFMEATAETAE